MKKVFIVFLLTAVGCSNLQNKERIPNQVGNDYGGMRASEIRDRKEVDQLPDRKGVSMSWSILDDRMCGPAPASHKCSDRKSSSTLWNYKDYDDIEHSLVSKDSFYDVVFNGIGFTIIQNRSTQKKLTSPVARLSYLMSSGAKFVSELCSQLPVNNVTSQFGKFRVLSKQEALSLLDETGTMKKSFVDRVFSSFDGVSVDFGGGRGLAIDLKCTWVDSGELVCNNKKVYAPDNKGVFRDENGKKADKGGFLTSGYYPVLCTSF